MIVLYDLMLIVFADGVVEPRLCNADGTVSIA